MAVRYYSHRHVHHIAEGRTLRMAKAIQLVWIALSLIEGVLLLRFGLRLLGANPATPFVDMIYGLSSFFLAPFRYILPASAVGRAVFEWTTVVAMLVYWLVGWAVSRLLALADAPREEVIVDRRY